jgi:hypothetical protein
VAGMTSHRESQLVSCHPRHHLRKSKEMKTSLSYTLDCTGSDGREKKTKMYIADNGAGVY